LYTRRKGEEKGKKLKGKAGGERGRNNMPSILSPLRENASVKKERERGFVRGETRWGNKNGGPSSTLHFSILSYSAMV